MLATHEEQIRALMNHQACRLVERLTPPELSDGESYQRVFTIKKHEILQFLKDNFSLKDVVPCQPGNRDGLYVLTVSNGLEVYYQERNIKVNPRIVASVDEVWEEYVDYLVRTSGTGLDFT
ncbi:MAG: hypothetical protein O2999_08575 [Nitrospirae bacterium]|nr:hypothetical protein [Nitrospirota bacterium]MDA1304338.1 hypothetical protein [Nitrospirota bacterium]